MQNPNTQQLSSGMSTRPPVSGGESDRRLPNVFRLCQSLAGRTNFFPSTGQTHALWILHSIECRQPFPAADLDRFAG
jgi:hypothetical protein